MPSCAAGQTPPAEALELHDLERAKWHPMMGSTISWSEEAARGRCLPRSGHGGWMPPFTGGSAKSPSSGGHGEALSNVRGVARSAFSFSGDLQTPGVVHPPLSSLLGSVPEEAASPRGLRKVPRGWRGESVTSSSVCFLLQDYIFYLEPDKLESGKGKCSYDPKVDTVSALISESCGSPGPVLPVLSRGNVQARWDRMAAPSIFPRCPNIPKESGSHACHPAAGGWAPGMPSAWAPGPAEMGVLVTDQCQPPELSGMATGSGS